MNEIMFSTLQQGQTSSTATASSAANYHFNKGHRDTLVEVSYSTALHHNNPSVSQGMVLMGAADIPLAAKHKQHPHQQRANTTSQFDASKSASGGLPLNSVPAVGETTNPPSMKITNPCTGISAESEKASGVTCTACHKSLCSQRSLKRHRQTCRSQNPESYKKQKAEANYRVNVNAPQPTGIQPPPLWPPQQQKECKKASVSKVPPPSHPMVMNNSPPVTSTSSPNSALSSAGVRGQCTTLHYYSPHPAASQHEGQSTQCLSTTYEAPPCYSHVYNYQNPQQQQQQRNSSLQHLHQQIAPTAIQMPPDVPQCQNFSGHGLNPKISLQTNQQSRGPPFNTNYYQPLPMQANPMPTQPYNGTYQNTALPQLHAPTGEQYNQFDVSVPMVEKHVPIEVGNNSFSRQDTCSIPTTPMTAPFSSSNDTKKFFESPPEKSAVEETGNGKKTVKKAKSNNKPGRAPLKPPDPSKPVYSYLCPECDKPYSCRKNVKKHRQKIHKVTHDEAYSGTIKRVIKVDDGTVVDPKIEKPPAKKAEPAQATATKKTTSLKKRKSEPQISTEQVKRSVAPTNTQSSINNGTANRVCSFNCMEDNVTPLSAPPFPNYRHQRLPQQFPPHPNEHLIGNKNAAVNFHHSVCHTPQAAPFTQRSLSFDQSQTHFYQMQQPPNEISNTLHCQQRYEVCNFMHPRNDCYEGPQSEPMAPHFHPMHYYSHEPNRYPDERQFFRDDLMTQKGSASSSAPNHSNYAEYWADFEQIKSNTDRPFMNRSRDDDIEMARIVADLKRSAESDAVPMFSTLPHEAIQHRHPGSNVPSQFFLNDGTVTGGRFVQTMRKPVERAEADSTFWEEDVTASARTSSDSTLGNPKNESPVHRTNTNPILVQVLNTDPPTFIRNNGAGPKHFVSSPNIHQTQVGIKTEGVSTDVDTKREQFHLGHFQVSNDSKVGVKDSKAKIVKCNPIISSVGFATSNPVGLSAASFRCMKCDRYFSTEYSLKRHNQACQKMLEKRNSGTRKYSKLSTSKDPSVKVEITEQDPDSTTLYQIKEEPKSVDAGNYRPPAKMEIP